MRSRPAGGRGTRPANLPTSEEPRNPRPQAPQGAGLRNRWAPGAGCVVGRRDGAEVAAGGHDGGSECLGRQQVAGTSAVGTVRFVSAQTVGWVLLTAFGICRLSC